MEENKVLVYIIKLYILSVSAKPFVAFFIAGLYVGGFFAVLICPVIIYVYINAAFLIDKIGKEDHDPYAKRAFAVKFSSTAYLTIPAVLLVLIFNSWA